MVTSYKKMDNVYIFLPSPHYFPLIYFILFYYYNNRRGAAAGMVLSAVLGAFVLLALIGTMCGGRRKRSKAWVTIAGMFVLYGKYKYIYIYIIE